MEKEENIILNLVKYMNGEEYDYNGILKYEGKYANGKRDGKGKEYYDNNTIEYEGEYANEKRNGKGKEYYYDGKIMYEGEYLNGKRWNVKDIIREIILNLK